ncbi:MAG: ATP--guanido phosphotransferase [Clostridia bacterium]|nr:ATP--guanido phosphotransferase [Clostridia bacterium]
MGERAMIDYTVVSSRVRLARNFADMRFPSRASLSDADKVEKAVVSAGKELFDASFYRMSELEEQEKSYLVERRLISPALTESPYGGALIRKDKSLSVMTMEEDHVRAQSFTSGLDLESCFRKVKEFDLSLRSKARLAFDKSLGYLTACPTNVGTGMRASVMLFLPALTSLGKIGELEEELNSASLTLRGALGEGTKAEGYFYQISNGVSLGVSEETILNRVSSAAERIRSIEKDLLSAYYRRETIALEDAIYRAFAILTSARVLSEKELESLIVNVKIGVSLGLIELNDVNLDDLALMCKPLSLVRLTGCGDSPAERDVTRADTVRKILKGKEG